jgi:TolA-binding protein
MIIHGDNVVLQEAIRRACIDDPNACQTKIDVEGLIRQKATMLADTVRAETASTLRSLIALMNGLARIDGRKTVFFLTEGFLAEQSWPFVEQAVGLAARANARVYTLDARGLDRSGMADHLAGANPSGDDGMLNLLKQFDMGIDSVNSLAVDSGGFVVRNHNYFDKAVEQIVAEAGTYYVLGYRPTKAPDGKFRRLSVHVARPGLVVRARRGYMATPREATTTPAAAVPPTPIPFPVPVAEATAAPMASPAAPGAPEPSAVTGGAAPAAAATSVPSRSSLRFRPDALAHVETLGQNSPADTDATAGWAAYQRGDLESARVSLAAAARRGSARPWVFYALGQSQYALRQYQDAAGAWEQVRSTTPEFKPVYFDLVDAYLQLKDYDKATRVLRDGETRWQRDPERLNALGVVQVARGSLDDAVQSFEQAIAAAPAEGTAYFNLGKACELRYLKNRRFIRQTGQWMANGNDRNKAIASYTRYLEIGGAFENSARDGLSRLGWVEK